VTLGREKNAEAKGGAAAILLALLLTVVQKLNTAES
jgi:hypothetical protein